MPDSFKPLIISIVIILRNTDKSLEVNSMFAASNFFRSLQYFQRLVSGFFLYFIFMVTLMISVACENRVHFSMNVNFLSFTSPLPSSYINSTNQTSFTVTGTCLQNGESVTIRAGSIYRAVTCLFNVWSVNLDLSSLNDGQVVINASHSNRTITLHLSKLTIAPSLASVTITNSALTTNEVFNLSYGAVTGTYTHYCIKENSTVQTGCAWTYGSLPSSYNVATTGAKVLSVWLRDIAGNVSNRVDSNTVELVDLHLSMSTWNFGNVRVGASSYVLVTISHSAAGPVDLVAQFSGSSTFNFGGGSYPGTGGLGFPASVPQCATPIVTSPCGIILEYSPTVIAPHTGSIKLGTKTVQLSGSGYTPQATCDCSSPMAFNPAQGLAESDPFFVCTRADLEAIHSDYWDFFDRYFLQCQDINLSAPDWVPIGQFAGLAFMGRYDGNFYKISNLVYNDPFGFGAGLFFFSDGAIFKNISMPGVDITVNAFAGALGALADNSIIINTNASGTIVSGTGNIGGLSGMATNTSVESSYSYIDITAGGDYIGGLIGTGTSTTLNQGYNVGSISASSYAGGLFGNTSSTTINNSYTYTNVSATTSYAGGLVGYIDSSSSVTDSFASGTITTTLDWAGGLVGYSDSSTVTNTHSFGNVNGRNNVGGLIGQSFNSNLTGNYSSSNVTGVQYVGGLVGLANSNSTLFDNYAEGDISVNTGLSVGGLIGAMQTGSTIARSYATGSINALSSNNVGGLLGSIATGSVSTSFATGNITGTSTRVGGLIGLTGGLTVDSCYAKGSVEGTQYIGGLIGFAATTILSNCYSLGNVTATNNIAGGLIGQIGNNSNSSVTNCYSAAETVSVTNTPRGPFVGQIIGAVGLTSNYFWQTGAINTVNPTLPTDPATTGITARSASQMQDQNTFTGWNFTNLWAMESTGLMFPYLNLTGPFINGFTPSDGNPGSTLVTINGKYFTGAMSVSFGTRTTTNFTLVSDKQITAIFPVGGTTGPIKVTTPNGVATSAANFSIRPVVISGFTPSDGNRGSTVVTINGSNFTGATSISFGTVTIYSFNIINDNQITATFPVNGVAGKIRVTTPYGTGISGADFVLRPVVVSSFNPTHGTPGVTPITITGSNFTGATSVTFGTYATNSFTVVNDTEITLTVPASAVEGPIKVTSPNGEGVSATNFEFTPIITGFNKDPIYNEETLIITGSGFTGVSQICFGGNCTTDFTVISDNQISLSVPTLPWGGSFSVVLNKPGGANGTSPSTIDVYRRATFTLASSTHVGSLTLGTTKKYELTFNNTGDVSATSISALFLSNNYIDWGDGVAYPGTLAVTKCDTTLTASNSCVIEIEVSSSSLDFFGDELQITFDDGVINKTISVNLTSRGEKLLLVGSNAPFEDIRFNKEFYSVFKIINKGDADVSITSPSISGDFSIAGALEGPSITNPCGLLLAANSSCEIAVKYSGPAGPTSSTSSSTLSLDYGSPAETATFDLSGSTSIDSVPACDCSPSNPLYLASPARDSRGNTNVDPFFICDRNDLAILHTDFAAENGWTDRFFLQCADIDLGPGGDFTPIGLGHNPIVFAGNYDGDYYTISNFSFISPAISYVGLFSMSKGLITNLGLRNINTSSSNNSGGLIGNAAKQNWETNSNTIDRVYTSGNISGTYTLGGLAGTGQNLTVLRSFSNASITNNAPFLYSGIGGLIGGMWFNSSISKSYATGNIDTTTGGSPSGNDSVGGLVGSVSFSSSISESFSAGNIIGYRNVGGLVGTFYETSSIENSFSVGDIVAASYVGGLVGHAYSGSILSDSYAKGNINANTLGTNTGGFIGRLEQNTTVDRCYSTGKISAGSIVGGLVGLIEGSIVQDSYTTSIIVSASGSQGGLIGESKVWNSGPVYNSTIVRNYSAPIYVPDTGKPFVGTSSDTTFTNNFFWSTNPVQGASPTLPGENPPVTGVTSRSATQMQQATTFNATWDFTTIWQMGPEGLRFPVHR